MSELRLIILIVGLFFIGAVFYWEMRRIKKTQADEFTDINDDVDYSRLGIATETQQDDEHHAAEISQARPVTDKVPEDIDILLQSPPAEAVVDDLFLSASTQELDIAEAELLPPNPSGLSPDSAGELISLFVVAETGGLPTEKLFEVLDSLGFRYGDMQIYHYFGTADLPSERPIFSLANMYEPGVFAPADKQIIKGVVLFFSASTASAANRSVFDSMLKMTRQIAAKLGAVVHDSQHQVLSVDTLQQIEERLTRLDVG